MIFVSHNLATVRYVSDTLAVMYLGRIVEVGPTEAVVAAAAASLHAGRCSTAVPLLGLDSRRGDSTLELGRTA